MTFTFSGTLLRFVDYQKELTIDGAETLQAAVEGLIAKYPGLRTVVYGNDGALRVTHRLFLNGEMLTEAQTRQSLPLAETDRIDVLTAIAGG